MLALLMLLQVMGPPADDQPATPAAGCGRAADGEVVVCAEAEQAAFRLPREAPRRGLPAAAVRLSRNATASATAEAISGKEPGVAAMVHLKIDF